MPRDKDKYREYQREYMKQWRLNEKNKNKEKEYFLKYNKTESGIKRRIIGHWRERCVISDDYNKLYEYYLSIKECENCGIELDEDPSTRKCLDHDHDTGEFRQVLCFTCNILRG